MKMWDKIRRKLMKLRLQPIRVFCFHQTSEQYDANVYCKPDWVPTSFIRKMVIQLRNQGYTFISLEEAHKHLRNDVVRTKKYAVLTGDDGLLSQAALLPWLESINVPITLFVDLETLDGKTCTEPVKNYLKISDKKSEQEYASKLFMNGQQLRALQSPMLTIGMHGVKHESLQGVSDEEMQEQISVCRTELERYTKVIPFFAYPFGAHSMKSDTVLHREGIIPVYADGALNYNDDRVIHREIMEQIYKKCQQD